MGRLFWVIWYPCWMQNLHCYKARCSTALFGVHTKKIF